MDTGSKNNESEIFDRLRRLARESGPRDPIGRMFSHVATRDPGCTILDAALEAFADGAGSVPPEGLRHLADFAYGAILEAGRTVPIHARNGKPLFPPDRARRFKGSFEDEDLTQTEVLQLALVGFFAIACQMEGFAHARPGLGGRTDPHMA